MFKVEIVQDEHQEGVRWLKASHNGVAWSLIEFRSNEEAAQIMVALQQSVQTDWLYWCWKCNLWQKFDNENRCGVCKTARR